MIDAHKTPLNVPDILRLEILAVRELFTARIDAMEKAAVLFAENLNRVPTAIDRQVQELRNLHDERFLGIERQFNLNEKALQAAFQASKELLSQQHHAGALAISKSEAATIKQIESIGQISDARSKSNTDKIDDLRERMTTIEAKAFGQKEVVTGQQASLASIIGFIVAAASIAGLLISLLIKH
jgi:hypothetical protein